LTCADLRVFGTYAARDSVFAFEPNWQFISKEAVMKRWAIRLVGLSAMVGVGWFAVPWTLQKLTSHEPDGPDYSKGPVNADAMAAWTNDKAAPTSSSSAGRVPSDPFQGISQSSAAISPPITSAADTGSARRDADVGGRYGGIQPRPLDVDTNAAPLTAPSAVTQPAESSSGLANTETPAAPDARAVGAVAPIESTSAQQEGLGSKPSESFASPETPARIVLGGGPSQLKYTDGQARVVSNDAPASSADNATSPAPTARIQIGADSATSTAADKSSLPSASDYRRLGQIPEAKPSVPSRSQVDMDELNSRLNPAGTNTAPRMPVIASAASAGGPSPVTQGILGSPAAATAGIANNPFGSAPTTMGSATTNPNSNIARPDMTLASRTMPATDAMASPAGSISPSASEGSGKPGDKKLEGAQSPSVTIEKVAPPEIQVGKPAKFEIVVRNTGPVPAENVEVTDIVPQGTTLISTTPNTLIGQRGEILWKVGDMKPGEESKLQVDLMPIAEGEIGSTAAVQFRSAATMRTIATKPQLVLELTSPKQVLIGENMTVHMKLSNPGTGATGKVMLQAKIPPQLTHPAGGELEFEAGQFKPGESRDLELSLHAVQAGPCGLMVSAQGDSNVHTDSAASIEVIAPRLEVAINGPGLRYLDRQAKYTVTVTNPGTAPAHDIVLATRLPKGMQFVEATDSGQFDTGTNSVMWGLDELPAGQSLSASFTTNAKESGEQKLRCEVKGAGGLSGTTEQVTQVEGAAAVVFTVADVDDPVEVGGQATYEIHVVNQGSKAANRLEVVAVLPDGMQPASGEGPTKQSIAGQQVVFEPLARLAPKADITYKVVGKCLVPGDMHVKVLLKTEEMTQPVMKEESTRVYKD
jgi:uncharacterized repeat protein (TIGR01451 family)